MAAQWAPPHPKNKMSDTQEHMISDRALHITLRVLAGAGLVLLAVILYLETR